MPPLVERVIAACENLNCADLGKLMALLRRFEAEAALDYTRAAAADVANLSLESAPVPADPLEIDAEALQCGEFLLSAA